MITRLKKDSILTRVVEFPPPNCTNQRKVRAVVLRFAWREGRWMVAAGPLRRRKTKLRWRPLKVVLEEAFGLDLMDARQLELQEATRE